MADKEWYWYDIYNIINTSVYKDNLLETIDSVTLDFYMFRKGTSMRGAYSRYDRSSHPQKLITNPIYYIQPNLSDKSPYTFAEVTDRRSLQLLEVATTFEKIFLFYSGGLDSTTILCSLLKNWSVADLAKITIVLNQYSINENQLFYEKFIKGKFTTVDTDEYFTDRLMNNDSLYITGDLGGAIMNSDNSDVLKLFSETYNKPWISNIDSIIKYFTYNSDVKNAHKTIETIIKSFDDLKYEVESVNDFFWWVNFNWGWDIEMYYSIWYWQLSENTDTRLFFENNLFLWYNGIEYQTWASTNNEPKIGDNVSMDKLPMKKYIFDFDGNMEYYLYKNDEASISKNKKFQFSRSIICGIDNNYNIYYRKLNTIRPKRILL